MLTVVQFDKNQKYNIWVLFFTQIFLFNILKETIYCYVYGILIILIFKF